MMYILYGLYNITFQIVAVFFLFFANTYLNDFVIPNSLKWNDGKLREDLYGLAAVQTIILLIEAIILILLMFYVNKRFLSGIVKTANSNTIALWTAGISCIIFISFIGILIYTAFK